MKAERNNRKDLRKEGMEATEVAEEDAEWEDREAEEGRRRRKLERKGWRSGSGRSFYRFNEKLDVRFFCYEILSNAVGTY